MRKLKFILPIAAVVFTIGMAFATVNLEEEQMDQYIAVSSGCEPIDPVCDNNSAGFVCQVNSASLGLANGVYDTNTCSGNPLKHSTPEPIHIP